MQVAAAAHAECTTSVTGSATAQACVLGKADVAAITTAFADAHAAATAEAFASDCTCTDASAWSFGDASIVADLVAAAHVEASAVACASRAPPTSATLPAWPAVPAGAQKPGHAVHWVVLRVLCYDIPVASTSLMLCCAEDQHSEATVYVDCYAQIIAKTFAYAAATASAVAGCHSAGTSAEAEASILVEVEAQITRWEECAIDVQETGLAEASHTPTVFTDIVRPTPPPPPPPPPTGRRGAAWC